MPGLSAITLLAILTVTPEVRPASLRGASGALDRQVATARAHGLSRLKDRAAVRKAVGGGSLVEVKGTRDLAVAGKVAHPYGQPALKLLLERLASGYRRACRERLVVTSLVRPTDQHEAGQSTRSVHPTGLAADLRWSKRRRCRVWLESTLLYLEARGLAEASREYTPRHYHVAVVPRAYEAHVKRLEKRRRRRAEQRQRRRARPRR